MPGIKRNTFQTKQKCWATDDMHKYAKSSWRPVTFPQNEAFHGLMHSDQPTNQQRPHLDSARFCSMKKCEEYRHGWKETNLCSSTHPCLAFSDLLDTAIKVALPGFTRVWHESQNFRLTKVGAITTRAHRKCGSKILCSKALNSHENYFSRKDPGLSCIWIPPRMKENINLSCWHPRDKGNWHLININFSRPECEDSNILLMYFSHSAAALNLKHQMQKVMS